jgi:Leucine-rich repeat (LRR) protein
MKFNIILLITILVFSCNKENLKPFCKDSLSQDGKIFQCHNNKVKDFSFLTKDKYKNLEALDLTGTSVNNLSFLKSLPNLKALLLINTKIKDITNIKYLLNLEEL